MKSYKREIDISDGMDDYIETIVVISSYGLIYQKHKDGYIGPMEMSFVVMPTYPRKFIKDCRVENKNDITNK